MARNRLPDLQPPTMGELRSWWRQCAAEPKSDNRERMRRLIIEVVRVRRRFEEIEDLRLAILKAWDAESGGVHQVGLYSLRVLLSRELDWCDPPSHIMPGQSGIDSSHE